MTTAAAATTAAGVFRPTNFFDGKTVLPGVDPLLLVDVYANYSSTKKQHHHNPHTHQAVYYNSSTFLSVDNGTKEWIIPSGKEYDWIRQEFTEKSSPSFVSSSSSYKITVIREDDKEHTCRTYAEIITKCVKLYHTKKPKPDSVPISFKALFSVIDSSVNFNAKTGWLHVMHPIFSVPLKHPKGYEVGKQYVMTQYQKNTALLLYFNHWWQSIEHHTPSFLYEGYCEYFMYCVWMHGRKTPTGLPMSTPTMTSACHSASSLSRLEKEAKEIIAPLLYGDKKTMEQMRTKYKQILQSSSSSFVSSKTEIWMTCLERSSLGNNASVYAYYLPKKEKMRIVTRAKEILTPMQLLTYLITTVQLVKAEQLRDFIKQYTMKEGNPLTVLVFDYSVLSALELRLTAEDQWSSSLQRGERRWMVCRYRCPIEYGKLKTALVVDKNLLNWMHLKSGARHRMSIIPLLMICAFSSQPLLQDAAKEALNQLKNNNDDTTTKKNKKKGTPINLPLSSSSSERLQSYSLNAELESRGVTMKELVEYYYSLESSSSSSAEFTTPIVYDTQKPGMCYIPSEVVLNSEGVTQLNSIVFLDNNNNNKKEGYPPKLGLTENPKTDDFGNWDHLNWWYSEYVLGHTSKNEFGANERYHFDLEKEDELNETQLEELQAIMNGCDDFIMSTGDNNEPQYTPPPPSSMPPPPPRKQKPLPPPSVKTAKPISRTSTASASVFVVEEFTQ